MNILLTISYDGTDYCGWQRQQNGVTVQEKIEEALTAIYGKTVAVTGASRTDSGVHALGQRAGFHPLHDRFPVDHLPNILNQKLPEDIVVTHAEPVPEDFHPRFDAKKKTYEYRIHNNRFPNPLFRRDAWHVWQPLAVPAMEQAAQALIGAHDFACFCATGSTAKTTVRNIYDLSVAKRQDIITLSVTGNGFLYNMVRIIAGTLAYVGMGKIKPSDLEGIIESKDRTKAGKTAPPQGLILKEIIY